MKRPFEGDRYGGSVKQRPAMREVIVGGEGALITLSVTVITVTKAASERRHSFVLTVQGHCPLQ